MPQFLMYYEETFVLISPTAQEQFLTVGELRERLRGLLESIDNRDLPRDLQNLGDMEQKLDRLLNTACDLDCGDRGVWQWYAVRLEK